MNKNSIRVSFLFCFTVLFLNSYATENKGQGHRKEMGGRIEAAGCAPASAQTDLNINGVRARMLNGGDMWWDLVNTAHYEVPKVTPPTPPANSIFAGSIWVAGIDENNQLKVSAQTYRQNGNDYFPGPLNANGTTTSAICNEFNQQWQVFGTEIDSFITAFQAGGNSISSGAIPNDILQWPGANNPYNPLCAGQTSFAPFVDFNGDGVYDPTQGDYPKIGQGTSNVYADQMIWWVYNDNGNIHTESGGLPIDVEIHALAFSFEASDEINQMTFYRYVVEDKSSSSLSKAYMAQWVDPDLGNPFDDYIGSDPGAGLGICYNGEPYDPPGGTGGFYGDQPPLLGVDFFQGPTIPNSKGVDDSTLHMTNFMYYNNDFSVEGNMQKTSDYYGYMESHWTDGTPLVYGGNGYGSGTPTAFAFPDDPSLPLPAWSECSSHDNFGDRRMILSSGPFTLLAGAISTIVVGVPWVQPPVGYYDPCPQFALLEQADVKAKALFANNFNILSGPPPPGISIVEESRKLILAIEDYTATENYTQADPVARLDSIADSLYRFEGYQIYQVVSPAVGIAQLTDQTQASLIFQCDIKDGVSKIINYVYDASVGATVPQLEVNGADVGVRHTFEITTDAFATTNVNLINFKTYYFMVLPYAYNGYSVTNTVGYLYEQVDTTVTEKINDSTTITKDTTVYDRVPQTSTRTQQTPYLPSRIATVYSGIPHVTQPEFSGLVLQSDYGSSPQITRQEGLGNGGLFVQLTPQSVTDVLANNFNATPTYQTGAGPVNIYVYDPKSVPAANFQLVFRDTTLLPYKKHYLYKDTTVKGNPTVKYYPYTTANGTGLGLRDTILTVNPKSSITLSDTGWWTLQMLNGDSVVGEQPIIPGAEQLIPDWGLSVYIQGVANPALFSSVPAVIGWTVTYANEDDAWLSGIQEVPDNEEFNWILAGSNAITNPPTPPYDLLSDWSQDSTYYIPGNATPQSKTKYEDPTGQYAKIFNGTICPYRFCSPDFYFGPVYNNSAARAQNGIDSLPSIDLVFTPDTSLWTRCCVIETCPEQNLSEGNVGKMAMRYAPSVNKMGVAENPNDPTDLGMGWFPGYAIDPERGTRLNVMFGENSFLVGAGGADMIWDPTATYFDNNGNLVFGGMQWVYVMRSEYDSCAKIAKYLSVAKGGSLGELNGLHAWEDCAWVEEAMLAPGFSLNPIAQGIIPTPTTLSIRVTHAYARFQAGPDENNLFPRYTFNTDGLAAIKNDLTEAKNALDTIKIIPNPYYAYSAYEASKVDNEVKIGNIPPNCVITIYSIDGTLINTINVNDNPETSVNWNMTNFAGVPISSGIYLFHINAPGIGEKTLKWFGIMRPVDISTF